MPSMAFSKMPRYLASASRRAASAARRSAISALSFSLARHRSSVRSRTRSSRASWAARSSRSACFRAVTSRRMPTTWRAPPSSRTAREISAGKGSPPTRATRISAGHVRGGRGRRGICLRGPCRAEWWPERLAARRHRARASPPGRVGLDEPPVRPGQEQAVGHVAQDGRDGGQGVAAFGGRVAHAPLQVGDDHGQLLGRGAEGVGHLADLVAQGGMSGGSEKSCLRTRRA